MSGLTVVWGFEGMLIYRVKLYIEVYRVNHFLGLGSNKVII